MPATSPNFLPVVIVAVVAWRIFSRVRRNIGRQTLRPKRMIVRAVIYAVLIVLLAAVSLMNQRLLLGLVGGVALGLPLAFLGLSLTKFEVTPQGSFYTPNPYIGTALSFLLAARLVYRLLLLSSVSNNPSQPPPLMHSPLTMCVFGILAGYYVTYSIGVLARSRTAPYSS